MFDAWGPYLHLQCIGTDPDFQRHGAGTLLINWGIRTARQHGLWTGLFASPLGELLYARLGFESVGDVTVRVEGQDEEIGVKAMGLRP